MSGVLMQLHLTTADTVLHNSRIMFHRQCKILITKINMHGWMDGCILVFLSLCVFVYASACEYLCVFYTCLSVCHVQLFMYLVGFRC